VGVQFVHEILMLGSRCAEVPSPPKPIVVVVAAETTRRRA